MEEIDAEEKIEIYSTDYLKIKTIGELLSSEAGIKILNLLYNEDLTALQIANRIEISLERVRYHIQKMVDVGIIKISKIEKSSKEKDMKYYRVAKFAIMILPPNVANKAKTSKSLSKSLQNIYKFTAIGIASVGSWLVSYVTTTSPSTTYKLPPGVGMVPENLFWATTISLIVLSAGLIAERIARTYSRKTIKSQK